jgi:hypothetical protein
MLRIDENDEEPIPRQAKKHSALASLFSFMAIPLYVNPDINPAVLSAVFCI